MVNDYTDIMSVLSKTTVHGHCVRVVNEYADTVSAWSTTRRTCISLVNNYSNMCQSSQQVNDYTDIMSAKSTTTLTHGKSFYFGINQKLTKK